LIEVLLVARDRHKTITEVKFHYGSTLKENLTELHSLDSIQMGIKDNGAYTMTPAQAYLKN